MIALIASIAQNGIIGDSASANGLPWHLPDELQYFRNTTKGKVVIMGRKTHEAIGRLLPGRTNIIITTNKGYVVEGAIICHSLEQAIDEVDGNTAFIIGGAELYKQALALGIVDELYITKVHADVPGDVEFPKYNDADWELLDEQYHSKDERHAYDFTMQRYRKLTNN